MTVYRNCRISASAPRRMRPVQPPMVARSLFLISLLQAFAGSASGEDPPELAEYLRKSTTWHCAKLDKDVPLNIYYITRSTHSRPWNIGSPVIVYVKNHGEERIGQEPDAPILLHYLNQRYIVITIDFENDPRAVSPFFDKDLHDLFSAIYGSDTVSLLEDARLEPREYRCFFLPAGCRVATDLVFWEIDKHGANGTLEYIMEFYNREIAGVVTGKEPVSDPADMTDRHGRPLQYKVAMDIAYPSQAEKKVPLVFYTSTQVTRHPNVAPMTYRPHMMGFTMRGYAYAIIDHCYNPIRRHFWHTPGRYSLDRWNGLACYSAAIRFIRDHADEFNVDGGHIGGMGHSKGQYSIARLSDLNHEGTSEARLFEGQPPGSPEPQPWPGHSSRISVGYQSPGNHSESITPEYAPTLVSHGQKDSLGRGYQAFFERLEELDINHVALLMRGLGHELPYDYDEELGVDRYALVHEFFDQYLKVEEKIAPVVLFTTPRDQESDVAPSAPISIQFAPVMDEQSVVDGEGVKIVGTNGSPVKGAWSKSRQGARFTFTPDEDFSEGEKYKVTITTQVKNEAGTRLAEAGTAEFTVGQGAVDAEPNAAIEAKDASPVASNATSPMSKTFSWDSPLLGKPISCTIHSPEDSATKKPVIVYLKNLPSPRLGGADDETLISGFLEQGMLVFVVDYERNSRAVAPELLPELDKWYTYLYATEVHPVDKDWIYILPEGYAIDRKVHICEIRDRPVGMDVIYPSHPATPVPLMLQITSTKEPGKWINQRAYYIYGLLTTGYAGAIMDWNGTGPGAAPGGDVFPEKRAARLLRARAADWNLSGRLGVTGHSKGSSRAGKAAFINEGDWESDRGPHADQSDRFQAALLSAGQHAPEFLIEDGFHKPVDESFENLTKLSTLTYVTPDDPPVFLSVGELDREFRVKQMQRLAARCQEVGVTYRLHVQEGMEHMYNPDPEVIGEIFSFLDTYLKLSPSP
jgi:acetyl esterase/lipase